MKAFAQCSNEQIRYASPPTLPGVGWMRVRGLQHRFPWHSHPAYSLGVVERGLGGLDYRGEALYTGGGDLVVINPDAAHTGFALSATPYHYRMFYVAPEVVRDALDDNPPPAFADVRLADPQRARQLASLHAALEAPHDRLAIESHFVALLASLVRDYAGGVVRPAGEEPQAIALARSFLHAHYADSIALGDLVALTHLTRAYFIRAFHRAVGLTPHAYLVQVRVERARELLRAGLAPAEVALAVGFADQSHLTRQFRRLTGTTPHRYATGYLVGM